MAAIPAREYHQYRCEGLVELGGVPVSPLEFYQSIFRGRVERVPVFVAGEGIEKLSVEDALHFAVSKNNVYINPCDYFKGWVNDATLKTVFAFVVDLDNIELGGFDRLFNAFRNKGMLEPTYIVNSGKGLHYYYVLEQPVEAYKRRRKALDNINKKLSEDFHVYAGIGKADTHGIRQAYRVVGSLTKAGFSTVAYRIGGLHSIEDLAERYNVSLDGEVEEGRVIDAKSRFTGVKERRWTPNQAFYDYTLKRAFEDSHEGHRYTTMFALVQIAAKCQVPKEQVAADLELLRVEWNGVPKKKAEVTQEEVTLAIKGYNEKGNLSPRASLEHFLGWKFDAIKRNGRKREIHLKLARNQLIMLEELGETKRGPKPDKKKKIIREYMQNNPFCNKSQIARATGVSRPTVIKYYDEIKSML